VIVSYAPGEVRLQSATPNPGFDMEIEDRGPDRVEVRFESDQAEYRVEVRWDSGELKVEIDQSGGEGHGGGGGDDDSGDGSDDG
jgi:hypothetical protein